MGPEDIKKLLVVVSVFLIVFLVFFFFFWRPRFSELRTIQKKLSVKQAELTRLERDAADWPDSITRDKLRRYEEELSHLWELIPPREEVSMLLKEIQTYARTSNLEIISMSRVLGSKDPRDAQAKDARYVRVPYKISVGGDYPGVIRFLRKLEESKRLVTVTGTKILTNQGEHVVNAEVQFNIFYSEVGVKTG